MAASTADKTAAMSGIGTAFPSISPSCDFETMSSGISSSVKPVSQSFSRKVVNLLRDTIQNPLRFPREAVMQGQHPNLKLGFLVLLTQMSTKICCPCPNPRLEMSAMASCSFFSSALFGLSPPRCAVPGSAPRSASAPAVKLLL